MDWLRRHSEELDAKLDWFMGTRTGEALRMIIVGAYMLLKGVAIITVDILKICIWILYHVLCTSNEEEEK